MPITVPYKVLADGYKVEGGFNQPTKATVPYLLAWSDAFVFYTQVLGACTTVVVGPVTFKRPHAFPPAPLLYAKTADIQPCGTTGITGANSGLAPGEYFKYAKVTVVYETNVFQYPGDDPNNTQQLDPNNPLTLCEQEIDIGGKMVTIKGEGLEFDDGTPVTGDQAVVVGESRLTLTFPRVPYLPWQLIQQYAGKINIAPVLACAKGTLLFENARTKYTETTLGAQGKQLQLVFCYQSEDWNMGVKPDGSHAMMRWKSDHSTRNYKYADFTALFLTYNEN